MSKPTAAAKVSTKTSAQLTVARLRAAATKAKDELKAANEARRTERASAKSQKEATKVERTEKRTASAANREVKRAAALVRAEARVEKLKQAAAPKVGHKASKESRRPGKVTVTKPTA